MKMDCDIVRDLLPLYTEGMVSEKSREVIDEHLAECEECKGIYRNMVEPEGKVSFQTDPMESYQKYVKKKKWSLGWKVAIISAAAVLGAVLLRLAMVGGLMSFLALDGLFAKVEVDTDVTHYEQYIGENAKEEYRNKWGMDESIFPEKITDKMDVKDYKMVYYDPWDAQYLSYLVVVYDEEDYRAEVNRLAEYPSKEYVGYYGAKGFAQEYRLLAMNADAYQGFVYALTRGDNEIIYVEAIFCNYFMDIDYEEYIDMEYLPVGFDAASGNPYRKEMMKEY